MTENITLPREVVKLALEAFEAVMPFSTTQRKLKIRAVDALRAALAAEQQKPEPVATVGTQSAAWKGYDGRWSPPGDPIKVGHLLRDLPLGTLLYAAPPDAPTVKESLTHPGYVIGSHWLETAYSRICAGEAEADVLRDIGLVREEAFLTGVAHLKAENEALRRDNERLREALKLALNSHGRMLMSDPPQDAWKFNRVDEVIVAALRREETT